MIKYFLIIEKKIQDVLDIVRERQLYPNIMTFGVLAMNATSFNEASTLMDNMETAGFR